MTAGQVKSLRQYAVYCVQVLQLWDTLTYYDCWTEQWEAIRAEQLILATVPPT